MVSYERWPGGLVFDVGPNPDAALEADESPRVPQHGCPSPSRRLDGRDGGCPSLSRLGDGQRPDLGRLACQSARQWRHWRAMRGVRTAGLVAFLAGAAVLAGLCFLWPAATAVREVFSTEQWADAALSGRRLRLLGRGLLIAVCAAALAQVLGAGLAAGLTAPRRGWLRTLSAWVGLVVLLTPPYIYAFAWSLVLLPGGTLIGAEGALRWPAWLVHEGRAVWCLGTWSAPVAAVVLAAGWRSSGRPAYTLALPDATPRQALLRGALPALGPWIAVGLIAAGVLALTEQSVCDLCQSPTWNTEVLSIVQSWGAPGPLLAWPLVVLVGLLLLGLYPFRRALRRVVDDLAGLSAAEEALPADHRRGGRRRTVATAVSAAILLLPWLILIASLQETAALRRMWQSFPLEWPHGLRYAAGCAVVSLWLAVGVDYVLTSARGAAGRLGALLAGLVLVVAATAAVVPAALVGDAFAAAYLPWPAVSDHWPVVSLVTAARFAIIPLVALRIAAGSADADLRKMAAVDGAGRATAYFRVRLPLCLPLLGASGLIVGLLALTEVPASHLVCPAGVESVALRLFNHIHYGRNDEIVAMALCLMAFVAVVVTGAQVALARKRQSPAAPGRP